MQTCTDYTCSILFSIKDDMSTPFAAGGTTSTSQYKTKGSAGFGGNTDVSFDAGTYYAQLTIEYTDGRKYTSESRPLVCWCSSALRASRFVAAAPNVLIVIG